MPTDPNIAILADEILDLNERYNECFRDDYNGEDDADSLSDDIRISATNLANLIKAQS